jgi:uncharacterized CHY-type Zn-finger protein
VRPRILGTNVDQETRCAHHSTPRDIVAIKMKCCDVYYACKDCHDALAGHPLEPWPHEEWTETAILCGACGTEMNIQSYLDCNYACPACEAAFNPGCRDHHHLYFESGALPTV